MTPKLALAKTCKKDRKTKTCKNCLYECVYLILQIIITAEMLSIGRERLVYSLLYLLETEVNYSN